MSLCKFLGLSGRLQKVKQQPSEAVFHIHNLTPFVIDILSITRPWLVNREFMQLDILVVGEAQLVVEIER